MPPTLPLCGPAGWSYPHWNAAVYPRPRYRGFHPLEYLARFFDVVEVNSSFYRPLRPELTRLWMSRVERNPSFVFTVKLGRRFTHERVLDADEVAAFKEGLRPMLSAGKLGCLLMQFPWPFRFTAENREYFIKLRRTFHEFPLAAEMRHSSWMLDEALGTFIDYRVGFCNIDQPEHMRAMPATAFLTSGVAYFRLHGRNGAGWLEDSGDRPRRSEGTDYLYPADELAAWKERILHVAENARSVFVTFTNDSGGKSVVNALQLGRMLTARERGAPSALIARQPRALEGFSADRAFQGSLFPFDDSRAA